MSTFKKKTKGNPIIGGIVVFVITLFITFEFLGEPEIVEGEGAIIFFLVVPGIGLLSSFILIASGLVQAAKKARATGFDPHQGARKAFKDALASVDFDHPFAGSSNGTSDMFYTQAEQDARFRQGQEQYHSSGKTYTRDPEHIVCFQCGYINVPGSTTCSHCGKDLFRVCPRCKHANESTAMHCHKCGHSFEESK